MFGKIKIMIVNFKLGYQIKKKNNVKLLSQAWDKEKHWSPQ